MKGKRAVNTVKSPPLLRRLGAGLITGAADDDPSGIATYSQVGAKFGYGMLWTVLLALPLMIGIQNICGRIGRVTGKGLATNLRAEYPFFLASGIAGLLFIANVINLSADIGAMGAALKLLLGGPAPIYAVCFALVSLLLQVFIPFERYSPILKLLTLSLFAYVATVIVVKVPWSEVARATIMPHVHFSANYAVAVVAVLGTTISPYLFFWQASQESQEVRDSRERKPLTRAPKQGPDALYRINLDTVVGMVFSEIVAFAIILTAAVVLHAHGKTDVASSADAAAALKPLAGPVAFGLFAAGIIGTGMLALPILAGSVAYALAETFHWKTGLDKKPKQAKLFYGALVGAVLIGTGLSWLPIDPMKMLYWSAVINGVVAVPLMIVIMLLSSRRSVMGKFRVPLWLSVLGWAATLVMAAAAIGMFVTWGH